MLQLSALGKTFGAFAALTDIDFAVGAGEIVALLGENGAGKSTLLNIVGGSLKPTSGSLQWNGRELRLKSPRDATRLGIGVVHQHFMLVPVFTVAENMALQAGGAALYNARWWEERVSAWAQELGWQIDPRRRIEELSVGERQRVEIVKALYAGSPAGAGSSADTGNESHRARLLLLDEPTANLTPGEADDLFAVLRSLRAEGCGIVFVSHKLNEVMALCDRVTVLRHGLVVGRREIAATDTTELATLMVGAGAPAAPHLVHHPAAVRLRAQGLGGGALRDFSLEVRGGEIVALAGVDGNGQADLLALLSGLAQPRAGAFAVLDEAGNKVAASQLGSALALIPPDRQHQGLVLSFDLAENVALHPAFRARCRRRFGFDWKTAYAQTRLLMAQFDVRTPAAAVHARAAQLSGGNQQKVVIARALSFGPQVLVAADPTRGLDVGATDFVHRQLRAAAAEGVAVLLVSTDLDEVLALGDRLGVLYEGRLLPAAGLIDNDASAAAANRALLGKLMGGAQPAPAACGVSR